MLKDLILRYSSQRATCKLATVLAGITILAIAVIEKMGVATDFLWMAAPLLLLGIVEAGYAAEQARCAELLKKSGGDDESSALLPEPVSASVVRFVFSVLSLSIWPFYLVLFGLVAFGGEEIAKANKEAAAQAMHSLNAGVPAGPYLQPGNGSIVLPAIPQRPGNGSMPLNRPPLSPALQRVTPPPFPTPPHFNVPVRSPAPAQPASGAPPSILPQNASPVPAAPAPAAPAPGAKNP